MKRKLLIASPCSADWDRMVGDDRVRHCAQCNLDVYNFSAMASTEIERIVEERQGRLCARFYQRSDGTMLTQNCPVGFRATIRRVSRIAGAALTAAMGTTAATASLIPKDPQLFQIRVSHARLALEVIDPSGAAVANAPVTLVNEQSGARIDAVAGADGMLRMTDLPAGKYEITANVSGLIGRKQTHVSVPSRSLVKLSVALPAMGEVIEVPDRQPNPFHRLFSGLRKIL